MDRPEEDEHRLEIVVPLCRQFLWRRFLTAGQLCSDLHAVGEDVVVILQTVIHHVPLGPVTDTAREALTVTQTFPGQRDENRDEGGRQSPTRST